MAKMSEYVNIFRSLYKKSMLSLKYLLKFERKIKSEMKGNIQQFINSMIFKTVKREWHQQNSKNEFSTIFPTKEHKFFKWSIDENPFAEIQKSNREAPVHRWSKEKSKTDMLGKIMISLYMCHPSPTATVLSAKRDLLGWKFLPQWRIRACSWTPDFPSYAHRLLSKRPSSFSSHPEY